MSEFSFPERLYKYRNFEDKFAFDILEKYELWFSRLTHFNDPFESTATIDDETYICYKISETASKAGLSVADARAELRIALNSGELDLGPAKNEFLNMNRQAVKAYCFSEKIDNLLMWSHYSHAHTGFCVELNMHGSGLFVPIVNGRGRPRKKKPSWTVIGPEKIVYQDKFPVIKDSLKINYVMRCLALTKSQDWSYEAEYRLFTHDARNHDKSGSLVKFPKEMITGLYGGAKISDVNLENLIKYGKKLSVPVYRMRLDSTSYKVVHEKVL